MPNCFAGSDCYYKRVECAVHFELVTPELLAGRATPAQPGDTCKAMPVLHHAQDTARAIDSCARLLHSFTFMPLSFLPHGRSGVIGWWPSHAVTFLDNHDTGSTQGHWPFPASKVMEGYAYILTHPGIPCVVRYSSGHWAADVPWNVLCCHLSCAGFAVHLR